MKKFIVLSAALSMMFMVLVETSFAGSDGKQIVPSELSADSVFTSTTDSVVLVQKQSFRVLRVVYGNHGFKPSDGIKTIYEYSPYLPRGFTTV